MRIRMREKKKERKNRHTDNEKKKNARRIFFLARQKKWKSDEWRPEAGKAGSAFDVTRKDAKALNTKGFPLVLIVCSSFSFFF